MRGIQNEKTYRNHYYNHMRTIHQRIGGNAFIQACQATHNQDYCSALRFQLCGRTVLERASARHQLSLQKSKWLTTSTPKEVCRCEH